MEKGKDTVKRPDDDRMAALKSLPQEVIERLTKEEVKAFLFDEIWPDSLREKLRDYVVEE